MLNTFVNSQFQLAGNRIMQFLCSTF